MFCSQVTFILLVMEFTVCGSEVLKQLHNSDFGKSRTLLFGEKNTPKRSILDTSVTHRISQGPE